MVSDWWHFRRKGGENARCYLKFTFRNQQRGCYLSTVSGIFLELSKTCLEYVDSKSCVVAVFVWLLCKQSEHVCISHLSLFCSVSLSWFGLVPFLLDTEIKISMKTATGILSGVHSESARNLDLSIVTHHEKKKDQFTVF